MPHICRGLLAFFGLAALLWRGLNGHFRRFKFLHAGQLLKHALGLARSGVADYRLIYLYYDWPGREAEGHRAELDRFAALLGSELELRVLTYQALFAKLRAEASAAAEYCRYLEQRYFPAR